MVAGRAHGGSDADAGMLPAAGLRKGEGGVGRASSQVSAATSGASLLTLRTEYSMELVWVQQAIKSRREYLRLREAMLG